MTAESLSKAVLLYGIVYTIYKFKFLFRYQIIKNMLLQ